MGVLRCLTGFTHCVHKVHSSCSVAQCNVAQRDHRKRSVGTGDKTIDRGILQLTEELLPVAAQAVIDRGKGIEQEERGPVDAEAHDLPDISLLSGEYNQSDKADERRRRPDDMSDAVEALAFVHAGLRKRYRYIKVEPDAPPGPFRRSLRD